MGAAPYALAAILAVQYLLFFMPDTESSFRNARDKMSAHIVRSSMRAIRVYVGEGGGGRGLAMIIFGFDRRVSGGREGGVGGAKGESCLFCVSFYNSCC